MCTLFAMHGVEIFIFFSWSAICDFDHALFFIIQSYGYILEEKYANVLILETYIGVKIRTFYIHELQKDFVY